MKKYSKYKDSGIEWIGKIPEHWDVKKLKFIAKICNGQDQKEVLDDNGLYPVYGSGGIFGRANKFLYDKPSVLLGRKGTIDRPQFVSEPFWTVDTSYYTKVYEEFSPKLFYYLCTTINFELYKYGSAIPSMTQSHLNEIKFSIPNTFSEQIELVNFLDRKTTEIDKLISNKERLIELLKEERTAIIYHAVTKGINPKVKFKDSEIEWIGEIPEHWETKRIRFLFNIQKRIAGKLGYDILSVTQKGVKIKDIESGNGQLSMDYSKYQIVSKGEFIMNHMDLLTGYVDISKYDGVTSPDYRVFSLKDENSYAEYFLYHFQNCYHNKIFFPLGQGSAQAGRWRLPTKNFNDFIFPVPPQNEQIEICNFLKTYIRKNELTVLKIEKEIELLKEYKTALISEVVTGKVDVREEVLA